MARRRRVNITLPPALHDRARALADRLPGGNVSALIEESLETMLPTMELAADALEQHRGDVSAGQRAFVEGLVAQTMRTLFEEQLQEENHK